MTDVQLNQVLDAVVPNWEMTPPENPPGNFLAYNLRNIMDDSQSIFGKSTYSNEMARLNRWRSTVQADFQDQNNKTNRSVSAPGAQDRGADKMMFMKWNVPDRLTTGERSRSSSRVARSSYESIRRGIPHADPNVLQTQLPQIDAQPSPRLQQRSESAVPCTPRIGLARLSLKTEREQDAAPPSPEQMRRKPGSPRKQDTAPPPTSPEQARRKPGSPRKPKTYKVTELMNRYYMPSQSAQDWLHKASDPERHMVLNVLKKLEEKDSTTKAETSKALKQWVDNANERERAVALEFFQSINSGKVEGNASRGSEKIQQIVNQIQRGRTFPGSVPPEVSKSLPDNSKLRYIRLLTPSTRENKWMHQTWHHLPDQKNANPVNNSSAIYTQPNKYISRHFTIHPDWGV